MTARALAIFAAVVAGLVCVGLFLFVIPFPVHAQTPSYTFTWTAVGDDSLTGAATSYTMKRATTRPDTTSAAAKSAWWNAASTILAIPPPAPPVAGTRMTFSVSPPGGWLSGTNYYVVIRATDDAGNMGGFSNVALVFIPDTIPPAPIIDLGVTP